MLTGECLSHFPDWVWSRCWKLGGRISHFLKWNLSETMHWWSVLRLCYVVMLWGTRVRGEGEREFMSFGNSVLIDNWKSESTMHFSHLWKRNWLKLITKMSPHKGNKKLWPCGDVGTGPFPDALCKATRKCENGLIGYLVRNSPHTMLQVVISQRSRPSLIRTMFLSDNLF